MKNRFLLLYFVATILAACSTQQVIYPYDFINTKSEKNAEMLLYSCGDKPNTDTLVMFCKSKKKDFQNGAFHFIVFFDQKGNASFPNNPLTGGHNDEEQLKHIKAIYTYNYVNGYSKINAYEEMPGIVSQMKLRFSK